MVDTGRCKRRVRDPVTGMTRFIVTWTSKASAEQRRGRAGRTAPGECHRTYTRAVFTDEMPEHTPPDILVRFETVQQAKRICACRRDQSTS